MAEDIEKKMQEVYDRVLSALRDELIKTGSTQEELAHLCGLTQPTMQRILKGKRGINLPFRSVLRITLALDISLAELISPLPIDEKEKLKTLLAEIGKVIAHQ